ncbi:DUF983 domain-containing protein [Planctomicrobium sp. SH668]|uniref:DUF983 domain-containing protein n=1 Tax=Planctomicrobium sp. SH668 TaxID=3448126 RepID=UPI003F5C2956
MSTHEQHEDRPTSETLLWRAFQLRCPRCGAGKLFSGLFRMNTRCSECNFLFDRGPGYYLGSMYVNYGLTAWITTIVFVVCKIWFELPLVPLMWGMGTFCLVFPTLFFRHARAYWLALDCQLDPDVLSDTAETEVEHSDVEKS